MSQPYRCPVCNGTGLVPNGFYRAIIGADNPSVEPEKCRSCNSTGIVWDYTIGSWGQPYIPGIHEQTIIPFKTGDPIPYIPPTICGESEKPSGHGE